MIRKLKKATFLVIICTASIAAMTFNAFAMDPPHDYDSNGISCSSCHKVMDAPGGKLTSYTLNADLCMGCHNATHNKPFTTIMMAGSGEGTSHAWNGTMPLISDPSNAYGLRNTEDLDSLAMKTRLRAFGDTVTCSVCHNQHSQSGMPWDPDSDQTYTPGISNNRHFMRTANEYNEMCQDCHYYRAMTYADASNEEMADGTRIFSHPVGEMLDSMDYNRAAPLDVNGVAQVSLPPAALANRFSGDMDGNPTNNTVLDENKKVRCLSCHRIHYVDSNPATMDDPANY